jgi:hypothetical protein
MFRELNEQETLEFQQWADDNYQPGTPINPVWHPVVQYRCAEINERANQNNLTEDEYSDYRELFEGMKDMLELLNIGK